MSNRIFQQIKRDRPLIHCIANVITVNDCANALLAIGASPTMAHHPMEVAEIATVSKALVLNMGAMENLEAMEIAGLAARKAGKPIVLDPVGASGAKFRRDSTIRLIEKVKPACIRGNVSEIRALAQETRTAMGVDASGYDEVDEEMLRDYSSKTGAIIVASGATDYVAYKDEVIAITGGSAILSRITGAGCMASCLTGAFLAEENSIEAVIACISLIDKCAEVSEEKTRDTKGGTMTFRLNFIDELSKM